MASNFVILEGKVYFAQADDSLTVLDLETGEVILRKKGVWPARTLQSMDGGILVQSYRGIVSLNPATLDIMWQAEKQHDVGLSGQHLITYDGNGLVACRELTTGNTLWSYNLPGALDIVVANEKVLVFRSAVFDGPDRSPAVVLLDLETGKETLHKTTPPGVHYIHAYFDGEHIYLAAGTYEGEHTPNITRYDKGRPSACFEELLVWDLNGNEIESIRTAEGLRNTRLHFYHEPFTLNGKTFVGNRVYDGNDALPRETMGFGELVPNKIPIDDPEKVFTRFAVEGGTLTMKPAAILRERSYTDARAVTISLESEHYRWTGRLPYLPAPGTLFAVGSTSDRILLGSNLGHVECIDAQTGRSLWMYVFPTIRHTMSYSSRGLPPYMATSAAIYKRENRDTTPESGMVLDGSDEPSRPKIILDPSPSNPFRKLPQYLAIAWSGAIVPVVLVGLIALAHKGSRRDPRIRAGLCLVLAALPFACFWFYGRVSLASSVGLRVGILMSLLSALAYSVTCVREKLWVSGAMFLLISAVITTYLFPIFVRL